MDQDLTRQIAIRLCDAKGWRDLSFIDAGNSGAVFSILHPVHGLAALKIYDPAYFKGDNALIEENRVRLQEQLRSHGNPYLIDVFEVGQIREDGTWYLVMELCPWQNLEKALGSIRDDHVEELLRQLVEAVLFLESKGLVHRDIKPANIVVDPTFSKLKLLDLGVLRRIEHTEGNGTDQTETKRFVATAQYSPPEYLIRDEAPGADGFEALNIYQVGAVLHDLIMKSPIFKEEARTQNKYILHKAITSKLPLVVNPNLPPRLISLCKASLLKDPAVRIRAVSLAQLGTKQDTPDELRRRLSASRTKSSSQTAPSILLWKKPVRDWLREAALREKTTLGPHLLKEQDHPAGIAWTLSFSSSERSVIATLTPSADRSHLLLSLSANVPDPLTIPVLEIFDSGPQIESDEVLRQLTSNILYILDI
ncbi:MULTISPECIES: protein kinase domain-containing protein [unclassified Bradyrhizobium]|uniref:protein kinase domain-containing protein n=1 Tax=unclassified Bradyrhizobium TaxID=2631580 RepID=UPI001BAC2FC5|nr:MULTISPECIES: protein kinase [unclassified Bradyrhizobium]MBR1203305.1 protein kinase [Bradyrhizobium sp. AUGA SZCCT0124]MBR1312968.1 protein kinase [Bradyrhizobium sp. AUGA SZCCT0051]MBR1341326.1 protein kinase [Bradyrhizobium sp. AUGA SZCCT0105]MBR1356736.1 protein kinase [Bradyrhizobium sp. AUGA SZCCT0045]